jgi:hypothetical protein
MYPAVPQIANSYESEVQSQFQVNDNSDMDSLWMNANLRIGHGWDNFVGAGSHVMNVEGFQPDYSQNKTGD